MAALKSYTGDGYRKVNEALRESAANGTAIPAELQPEINAVKRALSKLLEGKRKKVFRGTKLPKAIASSLQVGAIYSDPAFLSTSTKRKRAESFLLSSGVDDLVIFFEIISYTGKRVSEISQAKKEAEVSFPTQWSS